MAASVDTSQMEPLPQRNGPQNRDNQNGPNPRNPFGGGGGGGGGGPRGNRQGRGNRFGGGGGGAGGRGQRGGQQQQQQQEQGEGDDQPQPQQQGGGGGGGQQQQQQRRGPRGGGRFQGGDGERGGRGNEEFQIKNRLQQLQGPTVDIPPLELGEQKFAGRNRLYVGNLTSDVSEEELHEMFKPFGEISEIFQNKEKNFAFLKVDFRANAEKAKRELDGTARKNRQLRIRFAPNATTIKVKNLTTFVTNELLFHSFEIFGPVERAVVIVDERGKTTGEGFVEFARKNSATAALKYCIERCFFLTASLRPVVVEPMEYIDDDDGFPEKSMPKKPQDYFKERSVGPRFAEFGSFEHEYGTRWKQLHELYKQKHEALKREMVLEEEKLEAQMEYARYEHETEMLREQLRQRELDRDRQKSEWEKRTTQYEEQLKFDEERNRARQEEMELRMQRQEEELKRRQQENTIFMQAQQLNNMLDQQDGPGLGAGGPQGGGGFPNENRRNFDMMSHGGGNGQETGFVDYNHGQGAGNAGGAPRRGGGGGGGGQNRPWERRDDFPNKRRRF